MHLKNLLLFSVTAMVLISGCQTKVPYGSSYYFKLKEYQKAERQSAPGRLQQRPIEPISSDKLLTIKGPKIVIDHPQEKAPLVKGTKQDAAVSQPVARKALTRKEKRAARKEIRKTLQENKEQIKTFMLEDKQQQEDLFRAGLIIGLGGLALLVLGLAFGIGLLTGVGSLAIVVGFVLILIDLI